MSGWSLVLQSLVLSGAVIALVLLLLLDRRVGRGRAAAAVALLVLVAVIGGLVYARQTQSRVRSGAHLVAKTPELFDATSGFVRSTTCRACHPGQYATWHATFHRTMTQLATPDAVVGDFDDRRLENRGRTYHLTRRGDEFWVNLVDPDAEHDLVSRGIYPNTVPDLPRVNRRVVMTTGSHAQQTCWLESRDGRRLLNLPLVWLIEEGRWVPREDVFLRPPHGGRGFDQWNNNCIECHCVSGDENLNEHGIPESRVAELGITCEACHGPAAAHVQANRDPLRRYRTHLSAAGDPTIVNPRTLAQAASAQVCGQCHGMNVRKNDVARTGLSYRAGDALTDTKMILQISDPHRSPAEEADWARLQRHIANQPEGFVEDRFWPDGMVRVSGREHNAMVRSACYDRGTMTCLSCHGMHGPDPNDLLAPEMDGNRACLQCHESFAADVGAHTHHGPRSSGSECMNCHMPHTTYGLLKAIRSHEIDSPSVQSSLYTGRPNACSLCHLDQTLEWAARHLETWYGIPAPTTLTEDQRRIAGGVLWAVTGHANQRALIAWHMGWEPSAEASGSSWFGLYLAHLLCDPYAAVRAIAIRSLRRQPEFRDVEYDFVGSADHFAAARSTVMKRWRDRLRRLRVGAALLINADGTLELDLLERLSATRDDTVMDLRE